MDGSTTSKPPDILPDPKISPSYVDKMASDQPATPNQFSHFTYHAAPESSTSSEDRQTTLHLQQKSLGKRKATYPDDLAQTPLNLNSTLRQKKKRLTRTDSESSLGSKRVKIYDNLRGLDDSLQSGLDIVFCGINPGEMSSKIGHHYANPTNHFWSCLHQSGLTSRLLDPSEDSILPEEFSIGLTDLNSRPTIEERELSKAEQNASVPELMKKIRQHRPRITCFVGLGIANIVKSVLIETSLKSRAVVGLQPYKLVYQHETPGETLFYAVSSTSGRVVQYQKSDKVQQFNDLRVLVQNMKNGELDTEGLTCINIQSPNNTTAMPDD